MDSKLINDFLVRAAIPQVSDEDRLPCRKNVNGRENVIERSNLLWDAIYRAHRDVLTGRKNVVDYSKQKTSKKGEEVAGVNSVAQALYFKIKSATESEQLSSKKLIEFLVNEFKDDVPFGAIQKLVNMTLKYLFILQELGYLRTYGIPDIKEDDCDCPLDRIILNSIGHPETKWTCIDKDQYNKIQNEIKKPGLKYDFENYTKFQECPWGNMGEKGI